MHLRDPFRNNNRAVFGQSEVISLILRNWLRFTCTGVNPLCLTDSLTTPPRYSILSWSTCVIQNVPRTGGMEVRNLTFKSYQPNFDFAIFLRITQLFMIFLPEWGTKYLVQFMLAILKLTWCRNCPQNNSFTEFTTASLILSSQFELILAIGIQIRNGAFKASQTCQFLPRGIGGNVDSGWRVYPATLAFRA